MRKMLLIIGLLLAMSNMAQAGNGREIIDGVLGNIIGEIGRQQQDLYNRQAYEANALAQSCFHGNDGACTYALRNPQLTPDLRAAVLDRLKAIAGQRKDEERARKTFVANWNICRDHADMAACDAALNFQNIAVKDRRQLEAWRDTIFARVQEQQRLEAERQAALAQKQQQDAEAQRQAEWNRQQQAQRETEAARIRAEQAREDNARHQAEAEQAKAGEQRRLAELRASEAESFAVEQAHHAPGRSSAGPQPLITGSLDRPPSPVSSAYLTWLILSVTMVSIFVAGEWRLCTGLAADFSSYLAKSASTYAVLLKHALTTATPPTEPGPEVPSAIDILFPLTGHFPTDVRRALAG